MKPRQVRYHLRGGGLPIQPRCPIAGDRVTEVTSTGIEIHVFENTKELGLSEDGTDSGGSILR